MSASQTRAQSAADTLRQSIRYGDYFCGERLVEMNLAHELHLSQNTIREALFLLEQEGWVEKISRRGVRVRRFSPDEAAELYALWAANETLALEWAMPNLTIAEHERLRQTIQTADRAARTGQWHLAIDTIFALHLQLTKLAQKAQTAAILQKLHHQARLLENVRLRLAPLSLEDWGGRLSMYQALLEAVGWGDSPAARQHLMTVIMVNTSSILPLLT